LPCDPPLGGHSCNGGMIPPFHRAVSDQRAEWLKTRHSAMSAQCLLYLKADMGASSRHVRLVPNADIAGITRLPRSARYSSDGSMAPCRINNGIPSDGDAEGANEGRGGPERHCCEMQCQQRCAKSRKAGNGVR
jgi:hypothetical protein